MSNNRDTSRSGPKAGAADTDCHTRWDVVNKAKSGGDDKDSVNALEELCRTYRHPVYIALRYKHNYTHHDAEDLAQSFITWLIHGGYLRRADSSKGRFRTFLLTYLDNYVANQKRRQFAQKRGARVIHVPAEFPSDTNRNAVEPKDENTPDKEFDRAWTLATFNVALERLRAKFTADGRGVEFAMLHDFVLVKRGTDRSYAAAAAKFGISEVALRQRASRFARKFRDTLEEVIRPMVSEKDLGDEMSYLWRCFEK